MKGILVAVVLVALASTASASPNPLVAISPSAGPGFTARTATIDARSGAPVSVRTTLQPVVGSVQRTSHFTHPFTHKARYTSTVYNPVLGQFGTRTFRR